MLLCFETREPVSKRITSDWCRNLTMNFARFAPDPVNVRGGADEMSKSEFYEFA